MNNPLLKNNKTYTFEDLQNRTSHYNRILCARSLYSIRPNKKRSLLSFFDTKLNHSIQNEKIVENRKLVKSLMNIDSRKKKETQKSHIQPRSLKSEYLAKQQGNKIVEENIRLCEKIVKATAGIGSKKEWKIREKKRQKYSKILKNKREQFLVFDQDFYNAFCKIKSARRSPRAESFKLETGFGKRGGKGGKRMKMRTEAD